MRIISSFLLLTLFLATSSYAGQNEIKKNLEFRYPSVSVTSVSKTPMAGLYEVVVGKSQILYTDKDAKYLIVGGTLIETATKRNLTREKQDKLNWVDISTLPYKNAIKFVHGNGKRQLVVFSDPDCPFCRKLQPELDKLDNVTIHLFEFPLTSLHPGSEHAARVIWCSSDRAKSWDEYLRHGKLPAGKGDCPNPIKDNLALGQKLNVEGTPNLILPDGSRIPGFMPFDQLKKALDAASAH